MDYFVSVEINNYCLWQLEILIESFKKLKQEKNLVIAYTGDVNTPISKEFSNNFIKHERKFFHYNYYKFGEHKCMNKLKGLWQALSEGIIKQPLTILHPDMILLSPIELSKDIAIAYHENECELDKTTLKVRKQFCDANNINGIMPWIGLKDLIILNNVDKDLLAYVIKYGEFLTKEHGRDWNVEQSAWVIASHMNRNKYALASLKGQDSSGVEVELYKNHLNGFVIHYKKGLLPYWSKKFFTFSDSVGFCLGGDPYDSLKQHNYTKPTNYMVYLIESRSKE